MKKNNKKIVFMCFIILNIIILSITSYAHSGRTDSSGGHKDNQNKSGLGSYHYHCGGNPPHLHDNGVCPYSPKKESTAVSAPVTKEVEEKPINEPVIVTATSIQINENISEMKIGESRQLTANIFPENTTNKDITWKSSDEEIIYTDANGKITAKNEGAAEITVSTSNDKTTSITIKVIEDKKEENIIQVEKYVTPINNSILENTTYEETNTSEDSNPVAGVITVGTLGGGGYWLYRKKHEK